MTEPCKKCNGTGSFFMRLTDYAIGGRGVIRNKKGKIGRWIKCPRCKGLKVVEGNSGS